MFRGAIAGGGTLKANFLERAEYWLHWATVHPKPTFLITMRRKGDVTLLLIRFSIKAPQSCP
jgi:hypothetical protein